MSIRIPRLYAIIDPLQTGGRPPAAIAEALLAAGVKLIQYRAKQATSRELLETSLQIAEMARQAKALFIVNDRADVALAAGSDGVHLGQDDLPPQLARKVLRPGKWIGLSTHNLKQVLEAGRSTADYVAFGPVFSTASKEKADPVVGLEGLREARRATQKPLVAVGGITVKNAASVIEAGADSVAVISNLIGAQNVEARAREFLNVVEEL